MKKCWKAVHVIQHLIDSDKVSLSVRAKQQPLIQLYYQSVTIVKVIKREFLNNDDLLSLYQTIHLNYE